MGYTLRSDPIQTSRVQAALQEIVRLLPGTDVRKAIVFGSAAEGDVGRASDLDLLLVRPTRERFVNRALDLYALFDCPVALDLLVYTPEEFEAMQKDNPFVRRVVSTGRVIYEAEARV